MIRSYWKTTAILAALLLYSGTPQTYAVEPDAPDRLIDRQYLTLIAVRDELDTRAKDQFSLTKRELSGLNDYYKAEDARLIWVRENGVDPDSLAGLKAAFERADQFGLDPDDYAVTDGEALAAEGSSPELLARSEIRISLSALDYASHAQAGRVRPKSIDSEFLDLSPVRPEIKSVLAELAASNGKIAEALERYHPTHAQFAALKAKLNEARTARDSGSLPVRIPDGPALGPDTYHPQVKIVRERLSVPAAANAPDGNPKEYYDEKLAEAVRAFQESRGLKVDGIVGRNTREALNEGTIPVSINTIIANMERWRWAPREFGKRHIFVNVPEFKFRVISSGRIIHEERIVTGSPKHPTPVFSDQMETVVFNPYWHVPKSIIANEIIPAARRNLDYIYRNNMEVGFQGRGTVDPYMIDWQYVNPNKLSLRQRPGPGNALGRVKFLFPNSHAVYMHDTPSKHLFNRSLRAYSHGCIRVRNPLDFAMLLLRDQGWSDDRIDRALRSGQNQHVRLDEKVPVHISYFTAWVDDEGKLRGYRDIYGHDASVKVALKLDSRKVLASTEPQEFDAGEHGLRN